MIETYLVNPVAVENCFLLFEDTSAQILDLSFLRVVVVKTDDLEARWKLVDKANVELCLDKHRFSISAFLEGAGDNWLRLGIDRITPSSQAHMRSFLCPKKVGESLMNGSTDPKRHHFHGLNESELFFDAEGRVFFTYLDSRCWEMQFVLRVKEAKGSVEVGLLNRKVYMDLPTMVSDFELTPVNERDLYGKLGECRDIVTNFRPKGAAEYHLKQGLLRSISDRLYSTEPRMRFVPPPSVAYV